MNPSAIWIPRTLLTIITNCPMVTSYGSLTEFNNSPLIILNRVEVGKMRWGGDPVMEVNYYRLKAIAFRTKIELKSLPQGEGFGL